jgi:exodeoxyribonuclease VII small subunit
MSKDHIPANSESLNITFEDAVSELESIVSQMESKQLPLQETLTAFKRGSVLLQALSKNFS